MASSKRRKLALPKSEVGAIADSLKAIADPHRLQILMALRDGETCVCDLNDLLPLEQPAVSHHLRILREEGLITGERRGTWVYYRLSDELPLRLGRVLDTISAIGAGSRRKQLRGEPRPRSA